MRLIIYITILLGLSACSTTIPNVSNYLLPNIEASSGSSRIEVARIELSEYIDHKDVVLELDDGSLHRANFHKWGENLDDGIARLLERSNGGGKPIRVELSIARFHGSESGSVVFSGKWREEGDGASPWRSFDLESDVPKSGYANMVEAQAALVGELRAKIVGAVGE